MDKVLEKVGALKPQIRLGILGGIVIAIIAGMFFGLISPNREDLAKKKKELATKQQELEKMDAIARDYPTFKAELQRLEQELESALKQLPDSSQIPKLLTQISNLAKRAGLDVRNFKQKDEVKKGFYVEVPVDMEVEGTYHQIARFFQRVGEEERIININDVDYSRSKKAASSGGMRNLKFSKEETKIDAKYLVTTYRFLSADETKAAAEAAAPKAAAPAAKKSSGD